MVYQNMLHYWVLTELKVGSSPEPKAHWWAYRLGRPPSSVVVVPRLHCRPHSLNISSETTGPIKVIFHKELLWDWETKVCSNGPGHMTKVATIPIYGKSLKKSSLEPKAWWPWNLVCRIEYYKFVQMMTLGWPWPILWQGQIWSLTLLYGKNENNGFFRNCCSLWCQSS